MRILGLTTVAAFLCHATTSVTASSGDRMYRYNDCLMDCKQTCRYVGYPRDLPMSLKVFGWTCVDECRYTCMHQATADDVLFERPIQQFHGKWPFVRFLGIQEPASTLFSILNGASHIAGWLEYRAVVPQDYKMYKLWKYYMIVNVNAWLWSTVFHTRDLNWTEKMDYFSATSLVLASMFCFFVRVVGIDSKWKCGIFGVILMTMFCCHVVYLGFIKFDYGYNMRFNVAIGITNLAGWSIWCLKNYYKQRYLWKCLFINTSVFLLVGLEVFDFDPVWLTFDAHSLWHLGTVPFCYFWYRFLIDDAKYHLEQDSKKGQ